MSTTTTEPNDPRIERILNAAEQHGRNDDPDHEVGDLQDVLRAAWSLMTLEQRNQLMAAAETVDVLRAGDDFVEVAQLRAYLMDESGVHRVQIEVVRDGSGNEPTVSSLKLFDASGDELDADESDIDTDELMTVARRLDAELLESMPSQSVEPAWVSTIGWDLWNDALTHSVRIEGIDRNIQPSRWRNASEALDRHLLPDMEAVDRAMVMQISPSPTGATRWVEIVLDKAALGRLERGSYAELDGVTVGDARGGGPGFLQTQALVPLVDDHFVFRALEGLACTSVESGRVPTKLFLKWHAERPADETFFVSLAGELLNEEEGFERHHLWVDEYHRCMAPGIDAPETEFDEERPRG